MTRRVMTWPDLHVPEHDPLALACAYKVARHILPDVLCWTGDMMECAPWSRHPRKTMPDDKCQLFRKMELDPTSSLIKLLLDQCTDELVYCEGNHEHRVELWCANNEVGRDVFDALSPRAWFSGMNGVTWIPYQAEPLISHYEITPDLWLVHGWATGVTSEAKHLDACTNFSIIHGHTHIYGEASKVVPVVPHAGSAVEKRLFSMSPGCLRTLAPAWLGSKPQNWSHGLNITYISEKTGHWTSVNYPIFNGRCIVEGTEIAANSSDVDRMQGVLGL